MGDEHRAWRVVEDASRDAAEHHAAQAGVSSASDDDAVGVALDSRGDELVRGPTVAPLGARVDPEVAQGVQSHAQRRVLPCSSVR